MPLNKRFSHKHPALLLLMLLVAFQPAFAQYDDEDSPPPPPPPMMPPPMTALPGQPSLGNQVSQGSLNDAGTGKPMGKKEQLSSAGIEDITNENFPETIESFDFPNAEITDLVKAIGELTGKNFIIDPGVRGKITITAPSKITVAEAYKAFLSALAINGFAVVPSGKFLKIRSARNAQRDGIETYSGNYYPNADQMITRIVHLKHISAEMVNRDLRILTSKDGELSPYTATNSLIISDYGSNIERIMKILNQLDVPGFEDQLEVVGIHYAKAKDIADLVNKIVNKGETKSQGGNTFSAGIPRFSRPMANSGNQGGTGSAYFTVFPDDRTNSLIVIGNKPGILRVRKLVGQLDFRIRPEDSGGVHVYYLKYGDAEKIAQTLNGLAKDSGAKPVSGGSGGIGGAPPQITSSGVQVPQEIFGGDVKITADKGTNSLVVVASKQDYETVLALLNKLDIPNDQVYVEAIIMEMSATDNLQWQIGYYQYDPGGSGIHSGFGGFSSTDLQNLINPIGGTGAILGFGSGGNVNITPINTGSTTGTVTSTITLPSLVSFVNFLKTNAHGNVLSTPQILALNNQESTIEVGDKVITSQTATATANGVTTVTPNFEDATIKLKIKPFISPASNTIRMEVENSVKQLSTIKTPPALASIAQPLATRNIKTNIVIPNGDTAVLGGLMKDNETESVTKVPLLGDIPIIGWLFKSKITTTEKTNLVVFLTPKIIRSAEDSKAILNKKVDERLGFIKQMGGRDPYGAKVDEIQGIHANINGDQRGEQSGDVKK
jgi:general secretion pathway protein D